MDGRNKGRKEGKGEQGREEVVCIRRTRDCLQGNFDFASLDSSCHLISLLLYPIFPFPNLSI